MLLELSPDRQSVSIAADQPAARRLSLSNDTLEFSPDQIASADIIELEFPAYKDGRAYSQAQRLRRDFGFRGDLRATGDILRDQILSLVRCGFSSFEVADHTDIDGLNAALREFTFFYQQPVRPDLPVWALRQAATVNNRKIA